MKLKLLSLGLLVFLLVFAQGAFASYPMQAPAAPDTVVLPATEKALTAAMPALKSHLTFFQKTKLLIGERFRRARQRMQGHQSDGYGLSVLSFCLALGGEALLVALLTVLISSFGGVGLLFIPLGLAIGGLVTGILALAKRQRLKGLAIAGIVISSSLLAEFLGILLILAIFV